MPARESALDGPEQTGVTHADWSSAEAVTAGPGSDVTLDGLEIWSGPVGRIVAYDMNTGDIRWVIPNGDAPQEEQDFIRDHPLLQGVPNVMYNRGRSGHAAMVASPNLLFVSGQTADDEPKLFAVDKETGERVGAIPIPGTTRYGMSSWMHEGRQYVLVQLQDGLAAFGLPEAMRSAAGAP